jgi:hypothetical protein
MGKKSGGIREQLIACGDVDRLTVERDAAQATIPAAALPVNVRFVPVDGLPDLAFLEVYQVDATVALALVTASHYGRRD